MMSPSHNTPFYFQGGILLGSTVENNAGAACSVGIVPCCLLGVSGPLGSVPFRGCCSSRGGFVSMPCCAWCHRVEAGKSEIDIHPKENKKRPIR
mmetsp:Transcript_50879/g.55086  ORF Transcript_50879/g.55086 Transcript_50879/m.55086 type:complete len:94 (+) Transcript_50879:725-1006(+)